MVSKICFKIVLYFNHCISLQSKLNCPNSFRFDFQTTKMASKKKGNAPKNEAEELLRLKEMERLRIEKENELKAEAVSFFNGHSQGYSRRIPIFKMKNIQINIYGRNPSPLAGTLVIVNTRRSYLLNGYFLRRRSNESVHYDSLFD